MDINRALRLAISTGNVTLGMAQAGRSIAGKQAKLVIVANNCPKGIVSVAKTEQVPTYRFRGNNRELGAACGKPFSVSTVAILEEGTSEILALRPEQPTAAAKVTPEAGSVSEDRGPIQEDIEPTLEDTEPVTEDIEPTLEEAESKPRVGPVDEPAGEDEILEGVPAEE